MISGAKWGLLVCAVIQWALIGSMASHVDKAAMWISGCIFLVGATIMRGLQELEKRR